MYYNKIYKVAVVLLLFLSTAESQELDKVLIDVQKKLEQTRFSKDLIPPVLPNPGKSDNLLLIDKSNVSYYYDLLLPQMAAWIKDGWFVVSGADKTKYDWQYGSSWSSEESFKNLARIDKLGNIVAPAVVGEQAGFLFGSAKEINKEKNSSERAKRILWNVATLGSIAEQSVYGLRISWFSYETRIRKAKALLVRRSSAMRELFEGKHDGKFTQEAFSIQAPPVVTGYTQILNRSFDDKDDDIWLYSPVIESGRKLLHANRGDSIFESVLSMDDFFVWSDKVQQVNAKVLDEKEVFAPVPSLSTYSPILEKIVVSASELIKGEPLKLAELEGAQLGAEVGVDGEASVIKPAEVKKVLTLRGDIPDAEGGNSFVVWNNESRKYAEAASWLPTSVRFVPRKTWVVEVTPRDPYYPGGRALLYVDQDSMLPLFKVHFNVHGEYLKTVMGVWSFLAKDKEKNRYPVLISLLVVDDHKNAVVIDTEYAKFTEGNGDALDKELQKLFLPKEFLNIINPPVEEAPDELPKSKKDKETETATTGKKKEGANVGSGVSKENSKKELKKLPGEVAVNQENAAPASEELKSDPESKTPKKKKLKPKPVARPLWDQDEF